MPVLVPFQVSHKRSRGSSRTLNSDRNQHTGGAFSGRFAPALAGFLSQPQRKQVRRVIAGGERAPTPLNIQICEPEDSLVGVGEILHQKYRGIDGGSTHRADLQHSMSHQISDGMMPALVAMSSDEDESSTIESASNGNDGHAGGAVAATTGDVEMGADSDMPALVHVSDESGDEDGEHQPHVSARPSAAIGASAQNDAVRAVLFSSYEWIRRGLMPRTLRRWVYCSVQSEDATAALT